MKLSDIFQPTGKYTEWYKHIVDDAGIAVSVCGHAYYNHSYYFGESFARMIANNMKGDLGTQIAEFFKHLNGNWAAVVLKGNILYAVTDRTRSFPLLYNEHNGDLCLNDDIAKVCPDNVRWCAEGIEDFLWSGYPTGMLTLVDGVYQIPAGTFLCYNVATKKKSFTEYFSFLPTSSSSDSDGQLSEKLADLLDKSVRRAGEAIQGKIVVPLSGGMDSRVIAATLKRNSFDNVLCFSYGRKDNPESVASRRVAEELGYEWHFVEYSPQTWSQCMFSPEMKEYLVFASNCCSMSLYSNWYAVKVLCEKGILSSGDVFVPGHAGDFLAGSHIPPILFAKQQVRPENILSLVVKEHLSLWPGSPPQGTMSRLKEDSVAKTSSAFPSNVEATSLYEMWDWKERQAKMIINSGRVYEYFGFPWVTPLWDAELVDFYLTVPFRLRCNRRLFFQSTVEHVFSEKISALADIPLSVFGNMTPRQISNSTLPVLLSPVNILRRIVAKVKRTLMSGRRLVHSNHALSFPHCFAAGNNPLRFTVRQMLEMQGFDRILSKPECKSIVKFVDRPVGQIHAYAILPLFVLANLYYQDGG